MSLKENVEMVKEELNSEEKFFEKAVITERFVKKYKKPLIFGFVTVVLLSFGNVAYKIKEQNRLNDANAQLALLIKNPSNTKASQTLKTLSPKLFDLWSYSHALEKNDIKTLQQLKTKKLFIISDLSSYEVSQRKNDIAALKSYADTTNAIYRDLATIEEGIDKLKTNKIQQAKQDFIAIPQNSPLKEIAQTLEHYGVN